MINGGLFVNMKLMSQVTFSLLLDACNMFHYSYRLTILARFQRCSVIWFQSFR